MKARCVKRVNDCYKNIPAAQLARARARARARATATATATARARATATATATATAMAMAWLQVLFRVMIKATEFP